MHMYTYVCACITPKNKIFQKNGILKKIFQRARKRHQGYQPTSGGGSSATWLQVRPRRLGGQWGVGCTMCASLAHRVETSPDPEVQKRRRFSTGWARFEIRSAAAMQAGSVRKHANQDIHRRAVRANNEPAKPLRLIVPEYGDEMLLRGGVPQPEHWLKVWQALRTPVSFRDAARKLRIVERGCGTPEIEKRREATVMRMGRIMAEVIREQKRQALRAAASISLSIDDRGEYRLMRLRACCLPSTSSSVCSPGSGTYAGLYPTVAGSARQWAAVLEHIVKQRVSRRPPDTMGHIARVTCRFPWLVAGSCDTNRECKVGRRNERH